VENCTPLVSNHVSRTQSEALTKATNIAHTPIIPQRRNSLIGNSITRYSSKMLVPMPLGTLLIPLNTTRFVSPQRLLLLLRIHLPEFLREPRPHNENITMFEFNALPLRDLLKLRRLDAQITEALYFLPL